LGKEAEQSLVGVLKKNIQQRDKNIIVKQKNSELIRCEHPWRPEGQQGT
jgi:hypothetical protein